MTLRKGNAVVEVVRFEGGYAALLYVSGRQHVVLDYFARSYANCVRAAETMVETYSNVLN